MGGWRECTNRRLATTGFWPVSENGQLAKWAVVEMVSWQEGAVGRIGKLPRTGGWQEMGESGKERAVPSPCTLPASPPPRHYPSPPLLHPNLQDHYTSKPPAALGASFTFQLAPPSDGVSEFKEHGSLISLSYSLRYAPYCGAPCYTHQPVAGPKATE
jgi:hypothetical protein